MTKRGVYDIIASELQKSRDLDESLREISKSLITIYGPAVEQNVSGVLRSLISSHSFADVLKYAEEEQREKQSFDAVTAHRETEERFDDINGTETSTIYEQLELPEPISVERATECGRYHPSPIKSVRHSLDKLKAKGIKYQDYVFIDIGSGLGRNLLVASEYPFKKVIGVEISAHLCQKALANITKYRSGHPDSTPIEVHCLNALDYNLPDENVVLYFWEPFGRKSSDEFASKLEVYLLSHKAKIILIFLGGAFASIKNSKKFKLIDMFETGDHTVSKDKHFLMSVFESVH
jgi:SAM-dependent methyltransferase